MTALKGKPADFNEKTAKSTTRTILAVRQNKHKTEAFTALKIISAGCLGSSWRKARRF